MGKLGKAEAALHHGVPPSTVGGWLKKASAGPEVIAASQAEAEAEAEQSAQAPAEPSEEASKVEAPAKKRRVAKHYTPSQREEILEQGGGRDGPTILLIPWTVQRFRVWFLVRGQIVVDPDVVIPEDSRDGASFGQAT